MQSKVQCALMAQNEDDAKQRHRDMRMLMLWKQIESTERLVELKLKTSARMSLGESEAQVNFTINLLMEKLERFSGELETMMQEKRTTNSIVGNVLSMAAKAMGLAKGDDKTAEHQRTMHIRPKILVISSRKMQRRHRHEFDRLPSPDPRLSLRFMPGRSRRIQRRRICVEILSPTGTAIPRIQQPP